MARVVVAIAVFLCVSSSACFAKGGFGLGRGYGGASYVKGYTTYRGNYVPGHYRSIPNSTQFDNFGSKGNLNPYTGQWGTKRPSY